MTSLVTVLFTDPPRASILPWYFSLSILPDRTNFMFFRGSRAEVEVLNITYNITNQLPPPRYQTYP